MKTYLVKITLFVIPVFLLITFIEISIRCLPNSYKYKDKYVIQNKSKIEVLILGHSQMQAGIIPENIDLNCFSFAIDGQSLRYDLEIFEKYKESLVKLKYIILSISNFSLYFEMSGAGVTSNRTINYPLYLKIKTDEIPFFKQFEILSPEFNHKMKALLNKTFFRDSIITCLPLGNSTNDINGVLNKEVWEENAKSEGNWQHDCIKEGKLIKKQNEIRLKKLIEECKIRRIKVILTTPPVSEIYHDTNDRNIQSELSDTFTFCTSLSKSNSNVFYLTQLAGVDHLLEKV
jgi:hypothetical protein